MTSFMDAEIVASWIHVLYDCIQFYKLESVNASKYYGKV